ncbi:MAG TPA: LptE family protein [Candidatus Brocadiia bacterium]|nr:LptE family protein [Candidatus Brocadiia bacterium]
MRWTGVLLAAAFGLTLHGCGYHWGLLYPADVRTVHVKMFDNTTFYHESEVNLTQAVKDAITQQTPLKVRSAEEADSILTGTITQVEAQVSAYDQSDQIFTQNVTVRVDFEWRRRDTGKVIASASGLSFTRRRMAPRGETRADTMDRTFRDLAQLIVERMQENF